MLEEKIDNLTTTDLCTAYIGPTHSTPLLRCFRITDKVILSAASLLDPHYTTLLHYTSH